MIFAPKQGNTRNQPTFQARLEAERSVAIHRTGEDHDEAAHMETASAASFQISGGNGSKNGTFLGFKMPW